MQNKSHAEWVAEWVAEYPLIEFADFALSDMA